MEPAIKIQGVSKQYRIGAVRDSYATLRDALAVAVRSPFERLRSRSKANGNLIWALHDVTFDVAPGGVVGIIGRNGAGKSTLLKILSRITEPTTGRVELYGRVASLLEVGTGFHPELTGRENIFLNAAILGMPRKQIEKKFDEIVAFAEIEKFIDTPVKHYSSGMYVRLAFAVAAHIEPDILIVDEVLAVGDTAFQNKCLGKMQGVTRQGRTVLFVSHNMAAIKSLCNRVVLFEEGRIVCEGDVDSVIGRYLGVADGMLATGIIPDTAHSGTGEVKLQKVELLDLAGVPITQVYFGQVFRVALTLDVTKRTEGAVIGISISSVDGTRIATSYNIDGGQPPLELSQGKHKMSVALDVTLLPGRYTIDVLIFRTNGADIDVVNSTLTFDVLAVAENGNDHYRGNVVHGFVRAKGQWQD
jgi:lipopolysaccharide transport system ATP-binding protein